MTTLTQKFLVCMAFLSVASSILFSYLNVARINGLFLTTNNVLDDKYYQHITPEGIIFAVIWPIIYFTNAAGGIYLVVTLFLPKHKSPLKMDPTLIPNTFLIFYSIGWLCTVGWLFAFDREILELALALIIVAAFCLWVALAISYKRIHDNLGSLKKHNKVVLWSVRVLLQNFLCIPATWLSIATFIQLGDVIIYESSFGFETAQLRGTVSPQDGSSIVLAVLFATTVAWFFIQNFVLQKYVEQSFTVYPVLILGLSGLIAKLRFAEDAQLNLILASVQLGFGVLCFLIQICLSIYRMFRPRSRPSFQSDLPLSEKL